MTYLVPTGGDNAAIIAEIAAFLEPYGYKVTKSRAPRSTSSGELAELPAGDGRRKVSRTGRTHSSCAEHYRLAGMLQPVCVLGPRTVDGERLPAQLADDVLAFAADIAALAATAGDVLDASRYAAAAHNARHNAGEDCPAPCASCRTDDRAAARTAAAAAEWAAVQAERAAYAAGRTEAA